MSFLRISSSLALALVLVFPVAAAAPREGKQARPGLPRVAVLEIADVDKRDRKLATFLADEVRRAAVETLGGRFEIVMKEGLAADLKDNDVDMAALCRGDLCEVEIGRAIHVDYIVASSFTKLGSKRVVTLKLFDTEKKQALAIEKAEGAKDDALADSVFAKAKEMFEDGMPDVATTTANAKGAASSSGDESGTAALGDAPPPPAAISGPSSVRLAKPVVIRFADDFDFTTVPLMPASGGASSQTSAIPDEALKKYALAVARRHFEDASWPQGKKAKKGETVREIVIQSVSIVANPGPSYQTRVVVDRIQNGKRLGQATGQGFAVPDRSKERTAAAFVPGIFGVAASHQASKSNATKDAATIEIAVVQALDSACLQLAAYWAGEQQIEEMQKANKR